MNWWTQKPVEIGTSSDRIVRKLLGVAFIAKVFKGVGPEQVAHWPECWRLFEAIQLQGKIMLSFTANLYTFFISSNV